MSAALWIAFLAIQQFSPHFTWLVDWHAYSAAATELLAHTLYRVPLESAYPIALDAFNYPPLSAAVAVPLLALPDQIAGTIWVALNLGAMAGVAILTPRLVGARDVLAWSGLGFLAYTLHPWFILALLGNNTPVVLLAVVLFAHEHLAGRQRRAGFFLGVAIGLKLWPAMLIPLLVRERRWSSLVWAVSVPAITVAVAIIWLGLDSIAPAIRALGARDEVRGENIVLGFSWLREAFGVPGWVAIGVAVAVVAIPARGKLGLGLGILAGMAVIPNLWRSYAPTLMVGGLLVARGYAEQVRRRRTPEGGGSPTSTETEARREFGGAA